MHGPLIHDVDLFCRILVHYVYGALVAILFPDTLSRLVCVNNIKKNVLCLYNVVCEVSR